MLSRPLLRVGVSDVFAHFGRFRVRSFLSAIPTLGNSTQDPLLLPSALAHIERNRERNSGGSICPYDKSDIPALSCPYLTTGAVVAFETVPCVLGGQEVTGEPSDKADWDVP